MFEYRVRPVTRYIVSAHGEAATSVVGEFPNEENANRVALALQNFKPEEKPQTIAKATKPVPLEEMLRNILSIIESGELKADRGIMSIRAEGQRRPIVFGLGSSVSEPYAEIQRALAELERLTMYHE